MITARIRFIWGLSSSESSISAEASPKAMRNTHPMMNRVPRMSFRVILYLKIK